MRLILDNILLCLDIGAEITMSNAEKQTTKSIIYLAIRYSHKENHPSVVFFEMPPLCLKDGFRVSYAVGS